MKWWTAGLFRAAGVVVRRRPPRWRFAGIAGGWWGLISPLFTVYALAVNRKARAVVAALPAAVDRVVPERMPEPKRATRLEALGLALPVAVIAGVVLLKDNSDPANAEAGDCVRNNHLPNAMYDPKADIEVLKCDDRRAQAKVLARMPGPDRPDAGYSYPEATAKAYSENYILCLQALPGRARS